jgi:hypothetical protein
MADEVLLQADKCSTCIFRPGNPMQLNPGRLKDVTDTNKARGTVLMCHKTTFGQADQEAMCRGYYDLHGKDSAVMQVWERLGGKIREVQPE